MLDVTEQLERYASALGDAVPHDAAVPPGRGSSRWLAVACAAVVVAVGVWALIGGMATEGEDSRLATESGQQQLPVPAEGASPQLLDDGTPVWVVRQSDGTVTVLDAVSAHRPFGAGTLVGWCPSSTGFEDPMYGSLYDGHGRAQAGPAPTGLLVYDVAPHGEDTVNVTGPPREQPRQANGGPAPSPRSGESCFPTDPDSAGDYDPGTLELHSARTREPIPVHAITDHEGAVIVAEASIVLVQGRDPVACTTEVEQSTPPRCKGILLRGLELPDDEQWLVLNGSFMTRPVDGTLTEVAYVGERRINWSSTTARGVIYLLDDDSGTLIPATVEVPEERDRLRSTLNALFEASATEDGTSTAIPPGSRLVSVTVDDTGTRATVRTSGLFVERGVDGSSLVRAFAQIVWTATEHAGVTEVVLVDDDQPGCCQALIDGLVSVDRPVTRADYQRLR